MNADQAADALLREPWDAVSDRAATWIARGNAAVARWRWAAWSDTLWERPQPGSGQETTQRFRATEPAAEERERFVHRGIGADGQVVAARHFTDHWEGLEGGTQYGILSSEVVWLGDVMLSFRHERSGREHHRVWLQSLLRRQADERGRLLETTEWWHDGECRLTRYTWTAERLTASTILSFDTSVADDAAARRRYEYAYDYDADGLLRVRWNSFKGVSSVPGDSGVSWYRRSPAALRAARRLVADDLPSRILAWAARVAPDGPVYGLGIVHSVDAPELPPALGLGTLAELEGWREQAQDVDSLRSWVWSPAEYAIFDPVPAELAGDGPLNDGFALLNRDWELRENDRQPRATLLQAARTLLDHDWTTVLDAPAQFAIFVVADELDHNLQRQLRATVPLRTQEMIERGV